MDATGVSAGQQPAVHEQPRWRLSPAAKIALLTAVVAAGLWLYTSGTFTALTDEQRLEQLLATAFPWGILVFIAVFAVSHVVGFPSVLLALLAGMILPVLPAVAISWVGGMAGTLLAFGVARGLGRDWVAPRLPRRIRRFEAWLTTRPVLAVALVRLFTFLPPPADWFFGLSRMRVRHFCAGTAVGMIPPLVTIVVAGEVFLRWLQ